MQQQAVQTPRPWAPVILVFTIISMCLLTSVVVVGDGYLKTGYYYMPGNTGYGSFEGGHRLGLFNKQLKVLIKLMDELPILRAAQAFGILSMVGFLPAVVSSVFDFRKGEVSKLTGGLLFIPAVMLLFTWAFEVVLFRKAGLDYYYYNRHSHYGTYMRVDLTDLANLSWGFALFVALSVISFVLGGVVMCLSGCCGGTSTSGYVQQGDHTAQQGYGAQVPGAVASQNVPLQQIPQQHQQPYFPTAQQGYVPPQPGVGVAQQVPQQQQQYVPPLSTAQQGYVPQSVAVQQQSYVPQGQQGYVPPTPGVVSAKQINMDDGLAE